MTEMLLTHYDIVGSFLRPEELKRKQKNFQPGKDFTSRRGLTGIEDQEIQKAYSKKEELGLTAVTDWWVI